MKTPITPDDPTLRTYTDLEVAYLLRELHELGKPLGIQWDSATVNGTTVDFGDTTLPTLLNLLELLRNESRK
ncbi:hypothetical protein [Kitasatospora sp. NPDC008115]|uniref:hypothetical protein n=1 Tax=Kitasatospora sp. NPDC008115 TaxID=3364022 RepID=UPI0036EFE506